MNSIEVLDIPLVSAPVNNHPNFTSTKGSNKGPKAPKAPDKPLMPYMRYSKEIWDKVKMANPELKLSEISRVIGRMWREMQPDEKQRYVDDYDVEKVKYAEAFKIYQNSPAYQQYLAAKEKYEEKDTVKGKPAVVTKSEPKLTLPACDTDEAVTDDLEYFNQRQLAAARFHRNQRLLQEVFNAECIADMRQVITVPRLQSLKRQVETLTMHQKKIDTEITQLIETFETKKRRLEDGSREFQLLLEKHTKPAVTQASYESMVEQAERQLMEKYRAYLKNMEQQKQQQQNSTDASSFDSTLSTSTSFDSINSQSAHCVQKTATIPDGLVKTEPIDLNSDVHMNGGNDPKGVPDANDSKTGVGNEGKRSVEQNGINAVHESMNGMANGCNTE